MNTFKAGPAVRRWALGRRLKAPLSRTGAFLRNDLHSWRRNSDKTHQYRVPVNGAGSVLNLMLLNSGRDGQTDFTTESATPGKITPGKRGGSHPKEASLNRERPENGVP